MIKPAVACILALAADAYGETLLRARPVKISAHDDFWVRGIYIVLDEVSRTISCSYEGSMVAYVDDFYGSGRIVTQEKTDAAKKLVNSAIARRQRITLSGECKGEIFRMRKIRGSGAVDFSQ